MKAKELIKEVKQLNINEFIKFKKEFYKYVNTIVNDLAEGNGKSGTVKEEAVKTETVKAKAETVEEPVKEEPVKEETVKEETVKPKEPVKEVTKKEVTKKEYNDYNKRMAKKCQYQEFFKCVGKTGYQHGDKVKEQKKLLAISTKDSDRCVAAALVNHRGVATNVIYSPTYKYPMVFAKTTLEELEEIKELIMSQFDKNDDITKIGRNKKWNGKDEQLYLTEIEEGNFCYRMKDRNENIIYGGFMVENNTAFYKTKDGIAVIDMKYFFMPRWGTFKCRDNHDKIINDINELISRAFDNNNNNNGTAINNNKEKASDDTQEKTVKEEISAEVRRQQRMQKRLERGKRERVETKSKFSKPTR